MINYISEQNSRARSQSDLNREQKENKIVQVLVAHQCMDKLMKIKEESSEGLKMKDCRASPLHFGKEKCVDVHAPNPLL